MWSPEIVLEVLGSSVPQNVHNFCSTKFEKLSLKIRRFPNHRHHYSLRFFSPPTPVFTFKADRLKAKL